MPLLIFSIAISPFADCGGGNGCCCCCCCCCSEESVSFESLDKGEELDAVFTEDCALSVDDSLPSTVPSVMGTLRGGQLGSFDVTAGHPALESDPDRESLGLSVVRVSGSGVTRL